MTNPNAVPTNLNKDSVERLAERLAKRLGYEKHKDISEIVRSLGGSIHFKDFWDNRERTGSLDVDEDGAFRIFVPRHTSSERDRFTIAHELGHYVLHCIYNDVRPLVADRYGSGRVEWEANWFAASFLMPRSKFVTTWERFDGDLARMGQEFRVSELAVKVRAKSLGLE